MDLQLTGKVVLVTGGTDGLGLATARTLVAEGARVAICGRRPERLEAAVRALEAEGGDVLGHATNVAHLAELDRFVKAALDRWGRIDGVVNNAGSSAAREFASTSDEAWQQDLDLKLFAAIRTSRLTFESLVKNGAGAIVNVLNTFAKTPEARTAPTSVSRAAGMALTKVLANEWGRHSIRVNAVLVGAIESGQWLRRAERTGRPLEEIFTDAVDRYRIPLGRVGRADEFAAAVVFLLSPRSSYITGVALNVDGGSSPVV
jgi:NAD(P)-dependent dehydrogenase (short-subunit alcohol dehydrogenase family)